MKGGRGGACQPGMMSAEVHRAEASCVAARATQAASCWPERGDAGAQAWKGKVLQASG